MTDRLRVARVTDTERPELADFFVRAYADQPVAQYYQDPSAVMERWTWVTDGNPIRAGDGTPAWICFDGPRIVGHVGALYAIAVAGGKQERVAWARELILAKEARGQGGGRLLIQRLVSEAENVLLGGMNENVMGMYRRLGYVDAGSIPLFIRVLHPRAFTRALGWPGVIQLAARVLLPVAQFRVPRGQFARVEEFATFDETFDTWWRSIEAEHGYVIRRTADTMAWRYDRSPIHRYIRLRVLIGGRVRGYAVLRTGISRGVSAGFIVELLAAPGDDLAHQALASHAERVLRQQSPAFLRATVLGSGPRRALTGVGFLPVPSPIGLMVARATRGGLPLNRRVCFLNGGDSDFDLL